MKKFHVIIISLLAAIAATSLLARGHGMGPGMMMSGGMMGRSSSGDQANQTSSNPVASDELLAYIRSNNLPCSQCHSVTGTGLGPSFIMVSTNYANQDDAASILKDHIKNGFGRMPGGLADDSEAERLAKMILNLANAKKP